MDRVLIGADQNNPIYTLDSNTIKVGPVCVLSSSLTMDLLAYDEFSPVAYSEAYLKFNFIPFGSSGLLTSGGDRFVVNSGLYQLDKLPYGTPIWYFSNDVLMGKFYSRRVIRSGKTWFDIHAVSAIGLLDGQIHSGGIYTGQSFGAVATDIIGGAVSFSCAQDVEALPVFGWLPKDTRRANLHQLLFAHGVTIRKDANGDMVFAFPDTSTTKIIPDSRIFLGGAIDYMAPATRVDVTEHAFLKLPSDEEITLFDNTDGSGTANNTTVDFWNAPIHDIVATDGLTIHEYGVNYAVISGTGVLTGKRYTHTTRIISEESGAQGENKTVSVSDATLVSVVNSQYVANRVLSYYSSAKTITADIVVEDEKPGDQISFNNPFDDPETAFLSSMEITTSSFQRAACEIITGYVPRWHGNNYSNVVVLTGSGTWTPPVGVSEARVVLIGGGSGGWSGGDGESLPSGTSFEISGAGGAAGAGGAQGKVFSDTMQISGPISYSCGVGGAGGVSAGTDPVKGADGTDSTFGALSSASGQRGSQGTINLFTGEIYALVGSSGIPGGAGGKWNADYTEYITYPVTGPDGTLYSTGSHGERGLYYESGNSVGGYGGMGGGAAVGANGGDGGDGSYSRHNVGNPETYFVIGYGGDGGDGADAIAPANASVYGCGGDGGNGGGGAGGSGQPFNTITTQTQLGAFGASGKGSDGADGAPGCIIVYY